MTNRAEAVLYTDDDFIATIDKSMSSKRLANLKKNEVNYNLLPRQSMRLQLNINMRDESLVVSSVMMELLLSKKSKTDSRINKMDTIMNQILHLL